MSQQIRYLPTNSESPTQGTKVKKEKKFIERKIDVSVWK